VKPRQRCRFVGEVFSQRGHFNEQDKQFLKLVESNNLRLSNDDEGFIADIADLKYCSAFGETQQEAFREMLIAQEL